MSCVHRFISCVVFSISSLFGRGKLNGVVEFTDGRRAAFKVNFAGDFDERSALSDLVSEIERNTGAGVARIRLTRMSGAISASALVTGKWLSCR